MRLVPLLALLVAAPTLAQPVLGLKGGASVAWIDKDNGAESRSRAGVVLGGTVEVPLAAALTLQAEVLYIDKGESDPDEVPPVRDVKLAYVEVPVAVVWTVPVGGVEGRVHAGGFVAQRVAGDVGRSDAPDTVDAGVLAGLGLDLGALVVDARVEAGLRNAREINLTGDGQTRALTLTLGYRLGR